MKSCQTCPHGHCVSLYQNIWDCSKYPGWQHDGMCPDDDDADADEDYDPYEFCQHGWEH